MPTVVVVTNRIPVAEGHEADFEDRFSKRRHLVDQSPGFLRNEVHRPRPVRFDHESGAWKDDPEGEAYYEVKTWWRSFDDFVAWTKSSAFAEAHSNRPPKEMFSGPSKLVVHEVFLATDLDLSDDGAANA
ncbi:MAG: antibiotic biosynthesis monooxygenase [Myxococcales bacterium]|nr:antibiotic biosynthesis monooxygenase [Myxococcales bacterium]